MPLDDPSDNSACLGCRRRIDCGRTAHHCVDRRESFRPVARATGRAAPDAAATAGCGDSNRISRLTSSGRQRTSTGTALRRDILTIPIPAARNRLSSTSANSMTEGQKHRLSSSATVGADTPHGKSVSSSTAAASANLLDRNIPSIQHNGPRQLPPPSRRRKLIARRRRMQTADPRSRRTHPHRRRARRAGRSSRSTC